MYRSKIKATEEETKELMKLAKAIQSTPVIAFNGAHATTGGLSGDVRRRFIRRINEIAKAHGLRDQPGEWGFDTETGQFLSRYPIIEDTASD